MADKTSPFDWVADLCVLTNFMAASYENKIYTVGGTLSSDTQNSTGISDSYLRILDFSKPANSSKNSIDISTDSITTAIRLPDNIPRLESGALFISDGVMHMIPGTHALYNIADADGNILNTTTSYRTNLTNRVWNFDLQSQKWDIQDSGIGDQAHSPAVAFDAEKQVGWYYGGYEVPDRYYNGTSLVASNGSTRALQDLYRVDKGKGTPIKVEARSLVGNVDDGAMVYIEGRGEAGILVLLGGNDGTQNIQLRSFKTVNVFDIATKTWFAQTTTAENGIFPADRIGFCSVVATAEDNSSFNIYIYGGLDGNKDVKNDVFILTLPAFHWVSVYPLANDTSGLDSRQTYDHQCQKVYEKHMVAYRGRSNQCDSDKGLEKFQGMAIYDMSSLTWTTKVELENQKYLVPQILYGIIGGDASGNSTTNSPRQGFQDLSLSEVFATQVFINTTTDTGPRVIPPTNDDSTPVGAIAGGTVGAIVFVLLIAAFFFLRRKRKAASSQLPPPGEMPASTEPQELSSSGVHELNDAISELPAPLPAPKSKPDDSISKEK